MRNLFKNYIYPISTLAGTIIGVGFFALPYVASKVGVGIMLAYFLILGSLVILIHLIFGQLSLKTPDHKRLPGFAKMYLGKGGEAVAFISTILGIFGALLAYLIVGGEFLENLFSPIFGGSNSIYTIFYFSLGAILIFFGIKAISRIEFWALVSFFIILFTLFLRGIPDFQIINLFAPSDLTQLFLPYGIILFSLWGIDLIPEVEEMIRERKKLLPVIILISILIASAVYLFFTFWVLGITGSQTTESALVGLKNYLGNGMMALGFLFGALTTFTSFIAVGLTLRNIFWYDLKMNKTAAWFITCSIPFFLFFLGVKRFIPVISLTGGLFIGINGILILLMYKKVFPQKRFLVLPLILLLFAGIIYEIIYFVK